MCYKVKQMKKDLPLRFRHEMVGSPYNHFEQSMMIVIDRSPQNDNSELHSTGKKCTQHLVPCQLINLYLPLWLQFFNDFRSQ